MLSIILNNDLSVIYLAHTYYIYGIHMAHIFIYFSLILLIIIIPEKINNLSKVHR